MRKLRIVVVSAFPPPPDGIGAHTQSLAQAWVAAGHEVHVVARRGRDTPGADSGAVQVHRIMAPSPGSFASAQRLISVVRPHLVFVQFAVPSLGASWPPALTLVSEARRSGALIVVAYHEVIRELDLLGHLGASVFRAISARADVQVAFSPAAAEVLRRVIRTDVTALPLGVPPLPSTSQEQRARVAASYGVDRDTVLALGFTHRTKGTDVLIEAARLRAGGGAQIKVLIAGATRRRAGVMRFFERGDRVFDRQVREAASGVSGVSFCGFVPDDDLPHLLRAVGAMVLPYRKITQSGVATLALAAGLPSVASDLPGLRETLGASALYAPVGDPHELAHQLGRVTDDSVRQPLVEEARRRRGEMSYERVAKALLQGLDQGGTTSRATQSTP